MISLLWLDPDPHAAFPPVDMSLDEPAGLLAAGGDLSVPRLINAYRNGIFPWYSEGEPVLWWSPDPRFVLLPSQLKVSRSLSKNVRNTSLRITMDTAFDQVIAHCASQPREDQDGTWISSEMQQAYIKLHKAGHAHSVECWNDDTLVGGLYGIASGAVFCGESMFSRQSNASKIALVHACRFLDQHGFKMIDSQVYTPHLESLGARMMPRDDYIKTLQQPTDINMPENWSAVFAEYIKQTSKT